MANYTIKREMMNFSELGITPEELCTTNNQLEKSHVENDKPNVSTKAKISSNCSLDLEYETSDDPSDIRIASEQEDPDLGRSSNILPNDDQIDTEYICEN